MHLVLKSYLHAKYITIIYIKLLINNSIVSYALKNEM